MQAKIPSITEQDPISHTEMKHKFNKEKIVLISFDIWGTLLKNDPEFKKDRTKIFAEAIGMKSDLTVAEQYERAADDELDLQAEQTGTDASFTDRVKLLFRKAGKSIDEFPTAYFDDLRQKVEDAFIAKLPKLIEDETLATINELKSQGKKVALLSNTGFLDGATMRKALAAIGVLNLVDYAFFSNEIGVAKPHPGMYEKLLKETGLQPDQILHVGDNVETDYHGAWKSGISSILFDPKSTKGEMTSVQHIADIPSFLERK